MKDGKGIEMQGKDPRANLAPNPRGKYAHANAGDNQRKICRQLAAQPDIGRGRGNSRN